MGHHEKFNNGDEDLSTEAVEDLAETPAEVEDIEVTDTEGSESLEEEPTSLAKLEFDAVGEVLSSEVASLVEAQSESHAEDVVEASDDSRELKEEYSEKGGISSLIDKLPKGLKKAINVMMLTSVLAGGIAPQFAEAGIKDDIENVWKNTVKGYPLDYNKGDRQAYKDANKRAERYEKDRIKQYRKYEARRAGYYDGRHKAQQKAGTKYQGREIIQKVIFSVILGR